MYVNVHCDTFFLVLVLAGRKSGMLRSWEQSLQIEEINLYTCSLSTYELNQEHYTDFKKRPICKSANKNCWFLQWHSLKTLVLNVMLGFFFVLLLAWKREYFHFRPKLSRRAYRVKLKITIIELHVIKTII